MIIILIINIIKIIILNIKDNIFIYIIFFFKFYKEL